MPRLSGDWIRESATSTRLAILNDRLGGGTEEVAGREKERVRRNFLILIFALSLVRSHFSSRLSRMNKRRAVGVTALLTTAGLLRD